MTTPTPAIFFGHGNPLNALLRNVYTEGWAAIGNSLPRPRAVLCISAHLVPSRYGSHSDDSAAHNP